ncbi:MAG TPA: hypothetical protein VFT50_14105 [Baekduia sp.]|nr:hypothetical protein [Baekduia sp.]
MVRGPAAVLGLLGLAQAYVLVAPDLPAVTPAELGTVLACAAGAAAVIACVAGVVPVADVPPLLVLVLAGAAVLVCGFDVAHLGAAATPVEAVAYGAGGALFATALMAPSLALALPVFVAGLEVVSLLAGGPGDILLGTGATHLGDPLALELPGWGTGGPAGALAITQAAFAGVFLAYGRRYGFRRTATAVGLWAAIVVAVAVKVWADRSVPVLALMVAAYLLVNADRVPALARLAGHD